MDWLDLLAVKGTLKSLLQHHASKATILRRSAFFTVQLSHPYMTIGKTIGLTRHRLDGHEFEQAPGVGDGQGSLVCYSPWGRKEVDTTERLN